jgi:hypothetical protein
LLVLHCTLAVGNVDDFGLKPSAKRILMNTRWHEEDVAAAVVTGRMT